jgi:cytochrome P450
VPPHTRAPQLDVAGPDFTYESPEVVQAQRRCWYAMTPSGPVVLRHRQADAVLRDRRFGKAPQRYMQMHGISSGPVYDWWTSMMSSLGVEDHSRLRSLVSRAFSPRMVEELGPWVRSTAEHLAATMADETVENGVCEFVQAFADPLPTLVMCRLLGVPAADYDRFHRYSTDIGLAYSRDLTEDLPRVEAAVVALSDYVGSLIADRRRHLGDDLLSALIQVEQDGARLSPEELHDLVFLLVWAGQDTTARQLGRAVLAFAGHPDQWTLLARRPELALQAVEEVCRWTPQARATWRFATEDVDHDGLLIPAGGMVLVCIVAANRDPRAFEGPERFDITAPRRSRHLTFSAGIHHCLGVHVARLEMAEGLLALARRFGPPSVAGPITWRRPAAFIHGPDVLPLSFEAATGPAGG